MGSGRNRVVALVAGILVALAGTAAPAAAQAPAPVVTYQSERACEGAPTWRFAYRLYSRDSEGRTLDLAGGERNYVLGQAKSFADDVANFSDCGVRALVDVYEETAAWPAHGAGGSEQARFPDDAVSFRNNGRYDTVFYRVPRTGKERYAAYTNYRDVELPAQQNGYGPWAPLLFHEWLHGVVGFYARIEQGWPRDDVHGACNYKEHFQRCGYVDTQYFAAMMKGQVPAGGGRFLGIKKEEWARFGTPVSPKSRQDTENLDTLPPPVEDERQAPNLRLDFLWPNRVAGSFEAPGPVELLIYDPHTRELLDKATVDSHFEAVLRPGRYLACMFWAGDEEFYAAQECIEVHPGEKVDRLLELRRHGRFGEALLRARGVVVGEDATATWRFSRCEQTPPVVPPEPARSGVLRRAVSCAETRTVRREIVLEKRTRLESPKPRKGENGLTLDVDVHEFNAEGHPHVTQPGSLGTAWSRGG